MADQIRRFIELSKQLPDAGAILAAMRAQQQFEQQQATRGHQDDLTGLLLVVIKEIIDINFFTFVWLGRVLIGRAIPDTSFLNEEDTVLVRKIPASSEYVHIIRPQGLLFAAPGRNTSGSGNDGKADLYKRAADGTWSVFTTIGAGSGVGEDLEITFGFWWPAKSKFYVFIRDFGPVKLIDGYDVDVDTGVATALGQTSVLNPNGVNIANAIVGACVFGDNAYLVGVVNDPITGDTGAVFKFDGTTITRVDDDGGIQGSEPGLCGISTDETTIYWHGPVLIRSSTDGTTWALDENVNAKDFYLLDRAVYNVNRSKFLMGGQLDPTGLNNEESIVVRRDAAWVQDQSVAGPGNDHFLYAIGYRFVGMTQSREYVFSDADSAAAFVYHRAVSGGSFTQDTDLPGLSTAAISWHGKRFGSLGGLIFVLAVQQSDADTRVWSRASDSGVWTEEHNFGNAYSTSDAFDLWGLFEARINIEPSRL